MAIWNRWVLGALYCAASVPGTVSAEEVAKAREMQTIRPADTGQALVNPQMGWTFHHYSNVIENYGSRLAPSDTLDDFPGLSTVYLRLPWGFIEPQEGTFCWSIVDAPAQRWIDKGKLVAFRFSCSESWLRWATPEWVQKAGAKGYNFTPGKVQENGPYWEPDYGDPVFLTKLDRFLEAAAARYDGNPNVAFIDVGSFGVWGEGHTWSSTALKYPADVVKKHIDLYATHFKKTLLAANDDFAFQGDETIVYARTLGMTLRDDSILVQPPPKAYFHAEMAGAFWRDLPVILENEHYGGSRDRGNWGDGSWLLKCVEEYHASYASIHWWPREFLKEQRGLIDRINLRLGYRLQLVEASWPGRAAVTEPLKVAMQWANAGVAPCYPGGYATLTLKDAQGGIAAVFADESFTMSNLEVGPPGKPPVKTIESQFRFARNMKPGTYELFVSVGSRDGTPQIALPLAAHDGHRRYRLGSIEIVSAP